MNYKLILGNALKSVDQPNLIIYGHHTIDKLAILNEFLSDIDKKPLTPRLKNDIKYSDNNTITLFDMSQIKKKHSKSFFGILFEIIKCKNYYINNNRIIIINNFDYINKEIQDKFRVIFEKYRINTVFILLSNNLTSIINSIISRFLCIRISCSTIEEKISISYPLIKKLTYEKRCKIYDKIYQLSDKNEIIKYTKTNYGLINDYNDVIRYIYLSIKHMKVFDLSTLKEYAYMIEKYHIKHFHREFLNYLTEDLILSNEKIKNILFMITECEFKYHTSFNRILSNEYLLLIIFNETRNS